MNADGTTAGLSGAPEFTGDERAHAKRVVALVGPIIEPLARALEPRTEVVLHDLTKMPGTIAAIGGNITGRGIGGPATDLGLRTFSSGWNEHLIGYRTETADGLPMRSSSVFFYAPSGRAVVCLCLNTDVSEVLRAQELLRGLSAITTIDPSLRSETAEAEKFPTSVDELAQGILAAAVAETGVEVSAMKKTHKVEVVRRLRERGFFTMREAVPVAAQHLRVGRHTIYNYLNELEQQSGPGTKKRAS
ncbi:MAG: PAS domain-containing protein [Microbacterium sp.]